SRDWITPHSHRFNFEALVLEGWVENTIFTKSDYSGDLWCKSTIGQVCDENGITNYRHERENVATRYTQKTTIYYKGDIYSMHFNEIHSIKFSSGAKVLLFEGIKQTHISEMLEPWVNGKVIPTFKTENWMFEKINEPIKQDDDKENNNVA